MEFDKVLYKELKRKICVKYGVRHTDEQKKVFRKYIKHLAKINRVNYEEEEFSGDNNINIVLGDIDNAKIVICAHYDTPKNNLEPDIIKKVLKKEKISTKNYNDNSSGVCLALLFIKKTQVAIALLDNEEKLMRGSKTFARKMNEKQISPILINLDCVGAGKYLVLYENKISEKEKTALLQILSDREFISAKQYLFYPADTNRFKKFKTIGFSRSNRKFILPKLDKIHTTKNDDFIQDELIQDLFLIASQINKAFI